MANIQKLNARDHGDLKILQNPSEFAEDTYSPIVLGEMRALQACFPLLFTRNQADGLYHPVALFGVQAGENLFINNNQWQTPYVPMMIQRGPLLIGQDQPLEGTGEQDRYVAINLDHPNVQKEDGLPLFNDDGSNSSYLERLATMLEGIHQGLSAAGAFTQTLLKYELITPITFQIPLPAQKQIELTGLYAIDDEKLQNADESVITDLHRHGFLLPCYMMVASLSQMKRLINLKNQRMMANPTVS